MNRLLLGIRLPPTRLLGQQLAFKTPIKQFSLSQSRIVYKPIIFQFASKPLKQFFRKQSSLAPLNIDVSNLTKDVIVFKYNNPKYFKIMNIFGLVQFFIWLGFAEFTLSNLRDVPVDEKAENFDSLAFYERINLGSNGYKYGLVILTFSIGLGILGFCWAFTLRSVRYLILRKGGTTTSFVTYGPFGTNHILTVPLRCISAVQSRDVATTALPIKVKGKTFYYMLDQKGEYTNPEIFDHVINVRRYIE